MREVELAFGEFALAVQDLVKRGYEIRFDPGERRLSINPWFTILKEGKVVRDHLGAGDLEGFLARELMEEDEKEWKRVAGLY